MIPQDARNPILVTPRIDFRSPSLDFGVFADLFSDDFSRVSRHLRTEESEILDSSEQGALASCLSLREIMGFWSGAGRGL